MLADVQLQNLLNQSGFSNTDKLLLCLASDNATAKPVSTIKSIAHRSGLRAAANWNISSLLSRSKGRAVRVDAGWKLTTDGRSYVASLVGPSASQVPTVAASLRIHLAKISDPDTQAFVSEGIECFERQLYRSAVVLTWVGAIARLQDRVVTHHLTAFNAEAARRNPKWHNAKTTDDLGRMKEYDFLQVIERISVIGKNVKQELEKQLKLRNGCGHPNSLKVADHVVASHIEILILNVFTQFT